VVIVDQRVAEHLCAKVDPVFLELSRREHLVAANRQAAVRIPRPLLS